MKARKLFAALATAMALVGFVGSIIPAQARDYDSKHYRTSNYTNRNGSQVNVRVPNTNRGRHDNNWNRGRNNNHNNRNWNNGRHNGWNNNRSQSRNWNNNHRNNNGWNRRRHNEVSNHHNNNHH